MMKHDERITTSLARLDVQVEHVREKLDAGVKRFEKMEIRIASLEKFRTKVIAYTTAFWLAVGVVIEFLRR